MNAVPQTAATWMSRLVTEIALCELPSRQLNVLVILCDRRAAMTVGAVAAEAKIPTPAASRAISALSDRGLVANDISKKDRRSREIAATAEGHKLIDRLRSPSIP